jgi:predicted glycoside hydrolase/deacetylase ChbG (UPF0249 family)
MRLIVNADDYGLTEGVSAGIRQAHDDGIVTSTTVMMNCLSAADAIAAAKAECPALGLGVHLVLTAGAPLRPARSVRSLVTAQGCFVRLNKWRDDLFDTIDPIHLADEWRAQADAFMAAAGRRPTHLDSHHHIAYHHPKLLEVMLDLAAALGIPVRHPVGLADESRRLGAGDKDSVAATAHLAERMAQVGHPAGLVSNMLDLAAVTALAETLPPDGTAEAMCHPGRYDADLRQISSYGRDRETELAKLCDPALKAALAAAGIELVDFSTFSDPAPPTGTHGRP